MSNDPNAYIFQNLLAKINKSLADKAQSDSSHWDEEVLAEDALQAELDEEQSRILFGLSK